MSVNQRFPEKHAATSSLALNVLSPERNQIRSAECHWILRYRLMSGKEFTIRLRIAEIRQEQLIEANCDGNQGWPIPQEKYGSFDDPKPMAIENVIKNDDPIWVDRSMCIPKVTYRVLHGMPTVNAEHSDRMLNVPFEIKSQRVA